MRFLVDAQLPPALARLLAERGHVSEHVGDVGLLSSSDSEIWRYAIVHDAALITKPKTSLIGLCSAGMHRSSFGFGSGT